jgi:hypothetical protein
MVIRRFKFLSAQYWPRVGAKAQENYQNLRLCFKPAHGPRVALSQSECASKLSRKLFVAARVYLECSDRKGWWPMKNSNDSLFGFALAVVALVALLTVSHSWERSVSPLTVAYSKVSELGLRVSMHR